jgi:cell division protein FtsZ
MQEFESKMHSILSKSHSEKKLASILNDNEKSLEGFMPRIAVMGVGGAGTNAVELLKTKLSNKVDFLVCNTDVQSLKHSTCDHKIVLGPRLTKGKGAGGKPEIGKAAAEESLEEVMSAIQGVDMLIITGGQGGGTGTGAMKVIAKAARDEGILTIGVVTKPFAFEGSHRMATAENGIRELQEQVDTLIVSANDNLRSVTNGTVSFKKAFEIADTFLSDCVMSFISIIQETGLVNVDFADLCAIAKDRKSRAIMGTGYAEGDNCGVRAMEEAMSSLLLDFGEFTWKDVNHVIVCIHGGEDLGMDDVTEANNKIKDEISSDANIIMGATIRPDMKNAVRVFVFGTTGGTVTQSETKKKEVKIDYSYGEFVGTRHSMHEDVAGFKAKMQPKKKKGFLERIFGSNDDEDEVIIKEIPDFLKDDK